MKGKHLVMYESNPTGILSLAKLLANGVRITFLTADKNWYIAGIPNISDVFAKINFIENKDIFDFKVALRILKDLNRKDPIDGILTFSEFHIVHASRLAEKLGFPTVSSEAAFKSRNKDETRIRLAEVGIPQPKFIIATSDNEVRACVDRMKYPCIVKIADGTASQYVACVHNESELDAFLEESSEEDVTRGRNIARNNRRLVESFEEGEVVSVESLVDADGTIHALGINDRVMVGYPRFIEMGFEYLGDHEFKDQLYRLNEQTIKALGIDYGFVHIEFILSNRGPLVLEVNCRLAGCFIPELMTISSGIDPQIEAARMSLGDRPNLPVAGKRVVLGRYFSVSCPGRIKSIELAEAKNIPGVVIAKCNVLPCKMVHPVEKFNYDVIGYIVVAMNNREQARQTILDAISNISINLDVKAIP
jgi:biotin carboxylase